MLPLPKLPVMAVNELHFRRARNKTKEAHAELRLIRVLSGYRCLEFGRLWGDYFMLEDVKALSHQLRPGVLDWSEKAKTLHLSFSTMFCQAFYRIAQLLHVRGPRAC